MSSLTVHCGSFKTGSSSIQNHAWDQRAALAAAGWLYPQTGVYRSDPEVGYRHSGLAYGFNEPTRWAGIVDQLIEEIRAAAVPRVLLSSEAWSDRRQHRALAQLLKRLRAAGCIDEAQAVIYLRNRAGYLRSHYREFTRRRANTLPFAEYAASRQPRLDALAVLEGLRGHFGAARVLAIPYAAVGDIAAHFFQSLGLPAPPPAAAHANPGLDAVEIEARRVLNRIAPGRRVGFPGFAVLAARLGIQVDAKRFAEAFPARLLDVDASWQERFQAASGWSEADIRALCEQDDAQRVDVTVLSALIERVCTDWLATSRPPGQLELAQFEHPAILAAGIDQRPDGGENSVLGGYVVSVGEWRLGAEDPSGPLPVNWHIPSPRIAARYPGEAGAARARFAIPVHGMDPVEGYVKVFLSNPEGTRVPVFRLAVARSAQV